MQTLDQTTDMALDYAVRNNLLDGFFKAQQAEVRSMRMMEKWTEPTAKLIATA